MKKYVSLFIFVFVIGITFSVNAKYVMEYQNKVATIDIDRNPPKIEVTKIQNTNTGYEGFANKTHTVIVGIKVTEEHIIQNYINDKTVKVLIDGKEAVLDKMVIAERSKTDKYIMYDIALQGIQTEGKLTLEILEGTIFDKSYNTNTKTIIETKITVDNTSPEASFSEEASDGGKVSANILANEQIREIDGWTLTEENKKLEKEFPNNISYYLTITDLAHNQSKVAINITKATYIKVTYASHNSEIGWTYGHGNYDVAGGKAVKTNPMYKTEALALKITGNLPKDFVEINTFIYTHWGEGTQATCNDSGLIYNYGYNPSEIEYKTMNSSDLVTIDDEKYIQFGGSAINSHQKTDINGNNPIPEEIATQYKYGISGLKIKLKDYTSYSIVYQILVDNYGWINACSDGEEAMYKYNVPMSAMRMALVPKSEKQYILELWNQDVGTYTIP